MRLMTMAAALALTMSAGVAQAVLSPEAMAQQRSRGSAAPRSGSSDSDEDKLPPSVPPPVPTLAPARGIQGPRIEPGAVLCKTDADLRHRAEVNRRRVEGVADAGDPLANCRLVTQVRGVEVISRVGLGLVEVRLKPSGEVGWTDVYVR